MLFVAFFILMKKMEWTFKLKKKNEFKFSIGSVVKKIHEHMIDRFIIHPSSSSTVICAYVYICVHISDVSRLV